MSGIWPQLALVGVLVLINAAFAGTELALVSLRPGQIKKLEESSKGGEVLAKLARDPNQFLATIQIGITLAGFLASASAAVSLAAPLEGQLGVLGGASELASVVIVTIILAYLTLVLGELAPKRLAMQWSERWGLAAARPLRAMSTATRPIVWLLSRSTDIVVRVLGGDPNREREEVTKEEIREMMASQGGFSADQRSIISGTFDLHDRPIAAVAKPRPDVLVLDAGATCRESLAALAASTHSRAPVAPDGNLDAVTGVVHLRDLIADPEALTGTVALPAVVLPDSVGVLDALRHLQARRTQLAIVIDEHGGAEGIVTVEDLLEEIVGEIYDEADLLRADDPVSASGTHVVPGRTPIHELAERGIGLPEGDYVTIAGLLLAELGHIPHKAGDQITVAPWLLTVTDVRGHAITEVRLDPLVDAQPA